MFNKKVFVELCENQPLLAKEIEKLCRKKLDWARSTGTETMSEREMKYLHYIALNTGIIRPTGTDMVDLVELIDACEKLQKVV